MMMVETGWRRTFRIAKQGLADANLYFAYKVPTATRRHSHDEGIYSWGFMIITGL